MDSLHRTRTFLQPGGQQPRARPPGVMPPRLHSLSHLRRQTERPPQPCGPAERTIAAGPSQPGLSRSEGRRGGALVARASAAAGGYAAGAGGEQDTLVPSAFALTKVILGAGMTAIPRAYFQMGILAGTAMIVAVGLLTSWTKAVLVDGAAVTGTRSYASLAEAACGKRVALLLQYAIFCLCFGFMVVFQVVIADILVGPPGSPNGLLPELTGTTTGPLASRQAVISGMGVAVFAPLLSLRDMTRLAPFNAAGVTAVTLLAASVAALGATALVTGAAHAVPLTPNWAAFGDSPLRIATGLAAVVPVVLTCYVAHHSVFPIMNTLTPYSPQRMNTVVAAAIAASGAVFLALGLGGALVFGPHLSVNLLTNMSTSGLAPLVGEPLAHALNLSVRGGFLVSLVGSFVMFMFPLRTCMAELVWGAQAAPAKEAAHYLPLTYGTLGVLLALAVVVPDIWAALSFVGNVASTLGAFIIPALIALSLGDRLLPPGAGAAARAGARATALGVLALGVALFFNGILQSLG